jgi:mRNA-degrading endonuclease RelE of RelBE toxin-antitoxin system
MWTVTVRKAALKNLARAQERERRQVWSALDAMQADPMTGDVLQLTGERAAFRRRVGHWRLFLISIPIADSSTSLRLSVAPRPPTGSDE